MIEKVSNPNHLYDSARASFKSSYWKQTTQYYQMNLLANIFRTEQELNSSSYKWQPFHEFELNERGRIRHICSHTIADRVVQLSLTNNVLLPHVQSRLVYDNSASLKHKGVTFARKRFKVHLRKFYETYHTNEGYILQIDFRHFFESIPHDKLLEAFRTLEPDELFLFYSVVSLFSFDNKPISLGIGSPVSQICGAFYPTPLDNYIKCSKSCEFYARYQDDSYIMSPDKEELKEILRLYTRIAESLGLTIKESKTHITKLTHSITFLKYQFKLLSNGTIISRVVPKTITRMRRKLKSYQALLSSGKLTYNEFINNYLSWRGNFKNSVSSLSLKETDNLFTEILKGEIYGYYKN